MDTTFLTGLIGSLILVLGAAWPIQKKITHPTKSAKNWLFAIGGLIMLIYAILGYFAGGPIFFIFLEILVVFASLLMMLNVPDKYDLPLIAIVGIALIVWSLYLFEGTSTVYFILGLTGIGVGYAADAQKSYRNLSLTLGSALIAFFSYLEASWIFFWLNVFFAIFSFYYLLTEFRKSARS